MTLIPYIIFCVTLGAFINVDAKSCNIVEDKSPTIRLNRHLFCDYDPSERPVKNPKNATSVIIRLLPKIVEYDTSTHTMHLHTWYQLRWLDEYLQWKVEDFNGTDELLVLNRNLWSPDIFIENAAKTDGLQVDISNVYCLLYAWGEVLCVPAVLFSTRCDVDYTYWPFEKPNCRVEFSSWTYHHNEITFNYTEIFVMTTKTHTVDLEWGLASINVSNDSKKSRYWPLEESPTVFADFTLERKGNRLWSVFGTSAFILAAITLTTLWMDPKSNERLMIACTNFFCHFLYIGSLHYIVPQSHTVPNILIFYHDSIILAVVSLILTCTFRKIVDIKNPPPYWISSIVSMIMTSKLAYILSLSILDPKVSARLEEDGDDNSDLVNNPMPKKSSWVYVTIILGWISFISFFFTYIIMFAMYLHVPSV